MYLSVSFTLCLSIDVRLEKLFKEKQSIDSKRLTQSLTQTINTSVSNAVSNQLERCVKSEVKKTLPTGKMDWILLKLLILISVLNERVWLQLIPKFQEN